MSPTKGYTEMKDSGIEWVGPIPGHWDILRGKNVLRLLERPVKLDDDVVTCFRDGEVTLRKNRREEGFTNSLKEIGYQGIEPGDLIVHGMDGFAGAIGISDSRGKASPVLNVMDSNQNKRYLMYYLRAMAYKDVFMALSTGIRVRSCDLRWNKLSVFPFLIPTSHEQSAIAAYLDTQCAKIDEIIAQVKASMEDYKQWKASIIYEAVTKGLNPNVEMKDSGIEWIPLLPTAIKVSRVGLHFSIILGKMLCPKPLDDTYTLEPYFCAANVHFSGVDSENLKEMWFNPDEKERYRVAPGDLLVVEGGAGAGGCAVIETVDFPIYIQNSIMIVRSKRKNNVKYLKYFLETLVGRGYIDFACNKATIPHFTKEKLSAVPFPVFDCDTQARIVDFLDSKCGKIDDLIFQKQSLIDDLESYKKSLICEVVTGKRRVV